jgi:hypothetical protein
MADSTEKKKKIREPKEVVVIKNTYDYQRMKLDRLMKNPVRFYITHQLVILLHVSSK